MLRMIQKNQRLAEEQKKWKELRGIAKLQYLWDYYKFPAVILCICIYIIGSIIYGHFSHRDTVLYAAFVNVAPSSGLTERLSSGFLDEQGLDESKNEFRLYTGLYLTNDENNPYHEYTYASRMKILAAIDGEQLDIVLMDKEAFDAFSQNGYLCNLEELLSENDPELYQELAASLRENTVILEDNAIDLYFDDSIAYTAETEEYPMALDLLDFSVIRDSGFTDSVYLGILANSPRKDTAVRYIRYLFCK